MNENDDLGFAEIDKIFKARDESRRQEEQQKEAEARLRAERITLTSREEYETMHANNINITAKCVEFINKHPRVKVVAATVTAAAVILGAAMVAGGRGERHNDSPTEDVPGIVITDPLEEDNKDESIIECQNVNSSNLTIILRSATDNSKAITKTANKEFSKLGIDSRVVNSDDDLIDAISNVRSSDSNREIVVVNVDGEANLGYDSVVVMTNYSNDVKSADAFAMAIDTEAETFGKQSDVKCGKANDAMGRREATSIEKSLDEAQIKDVACVTVAPPRVQIEGEVNSNTMATIIVNGVIRTMAVENRYDDIIVRAEIDDNLSQLAEDYNVDVNELIRNNSSTLESTNGMLVDGMPIVVGQLPKQLSSQVSVNNPTVTSNPEDIKTENKTYEVKSGDTLSSIADKLGVPVSSLVTSNEDSSLIKPGDIIGYETTSGPILVSSANSKQY